MPNTVINRRVVIARTRTIPMAKPTGLSGTSEAPEDVLLTWNDKSTVEDGFKVERSNDGIIWVEIASIAADSEQYLDTTTTLGNTYYYRVKAFSGAFGDSEYSNVFVITVSLTAGIGTMEIGTTFEVA